MKKWLLFLAVSIPFSFSLLYASSIPKFDFAELVEISEWVIIGEVLQVEKAGGVRYHQAQIAVKAEIKGTITSHEGVIPVLFSTRGVKGFDTVPKVGDQGVYFLRGPAEGGYSLARFGGIALFEPNRFK